MTNNSIVGKWNWWKITYQFYNDGTYSYVNASSGVRTNGTYTISDNIITFYIGYANTSEFSLQGDELLLRPLTPQRGDCNIFRRVY
jgi:hypothetical protein